MRFGTWTKESLFRAVERFLSFPRELCVLCHGKMGTHLLRDGKNKCCDDCHLKLCRRKFGYIRRDERDINLYRRRVVSARSPSTNSVDSKQDQ